MSTPYLWTEHYRPKTLDDYVWRDPKQREKVEEWIKQGVLPHLMFSGASGTGKTSLILLMLRLMNIPSGDILFIRASNERRIEDIQSKITNFAGTWALGETGVKYIILDEADALSTLSQRLLRGEIEAHSDVCRFLFSLNYVSKMAPEIRGRCQGFDFQALDQDEFVMRLIHILSEENVSFDDEALIGIVDATYPNLRQAINVAQQSTINNVLNKPEKNDASNTKDYLLEMVALFKSGRISDGRKLIVAQAQEEDYPDIYRFFYKNLDLWGETEDQKDDALLIIRKGLVQHSAIADPEINLSACLVELIRISNQ